jgi:hypothetical protein
MAGRVSIRYTARCDVCGRVGEEQPSTAKVGKTGKQHVNDTAHTGERIVPLWEPFENEENK